MEQQLFTSPEHGWTRVVALLNCETPAECEAFHDLNFAAWLGITRDIESMTGRGVVFGLGEQWARPPYPVPSDLILFSTPYQRGAVFTPGLAAPETLLMKLSAAYDTLSVVFPIHGAELSLSTLLEFADKRDAWRFLEIASFPPLIAATSEMIFGGNRLGLRLSSEIAGTLLTTWEGTWQVRSL